MLGLMIAVVIFNLIFWGSKKRLTKIQMVQVWLFTVLFQLVFDLFVSLKYSGYWYFTKEVDWASIPAYVFLVPPVNLLFLNRYPFKLGLLKQAIYIIGFHIFVLMYELVTLLPEPWGYFHYGWWNFWYSVVLNPILFIILIGFYKWILKLEMISVIERQRFN